MSSVFYIYLYFAIGLALYFWLLYSKHRVKQLFTSRYGHDKGLLYYFLTEKLSGFLWMGIIPFFLFTIGGIGFADMLAGIRWQNTQLVFLVALPAIALVLIINFIRAGKPVNYEQYPQLRIKEWSISDVILYCFGWILYLLGYEYLFRGLLFYAALTVMPLWDAIAINCVLYAVAHLPKGKFETLGSFPFGIVLCLITYYTGSFWACFLIHIFLAVSNSMIALYAHPDMRVLRKLKL